MPIPVGTTLDQGNVLPKKKKRKQGKDQNTPANGFSGVNPSAPSAPTGKPIGVRGPATADAQHPIGELIYSPEQAQSTDLSALNVSASLRNLQNAYFDWHHSNLPADKAAMLLINLPRMPVSKEDAQALLSPLSLVEKTNPVTQLQQGRFPTGHTIGPLKMYGADNTDITFERIADASPDDPLFNERSTAGKKWAATEKDKPVGLDLGEKLHTSPAVVKATLRDLHDLIKPRKIDLTPFDQAATIDDYSGVQDWKLMRADQMTTQGKKVPDWLNPTNADWNPKLQNDYKLWLAKGQLAAMQFGDKEEKAQAEKVLGVVMSPYVQQNLKKMVASMSDAGVQDDGILQLIYKGYADYRLPGQTDTHKRWEYVDHFGRDKLPQAEAATASKEEKTLAWAFSAAGLFDKWSSAMDHVGEWLDAPLDKRAPSSHVFAAAHEVNKLFWEQGADLSFFGTAGNYAERLAVTVLDVLHSATDYQNVPKDANFVEKTLRNDIPIHVGNLVATQQWAKSYNDAGGRMAIEYAAEKACNAYGWDAKNPYLRWAVTAADYISLIYVMGKAGKVAGAGLKAGSRAGWEAGRAVDLGIRSGRYSSQAGEWALKIPKEDLAKFSAADREKAWKLQAKHEELTSRLEADASASEGRAVDADIAAQGNLDAPLTYPQMRQFILSRGGLKPNAETWGESGTIGEKNAQAHGLVRKPTKGKPTKGVPQPQAADTIIAELPESMHITSADELFAWLDKNKPVKGARKSATPKSLVDQWMKEADATKAELESLVAKYKAKGAEILPGQAAVETPTGPYKVGDRVRVARTSPRDEAGSKLDVHREATGKITQIDTLPDGTVEFKVEGVDQPWHRAEDILGHERRTVARPEEPAPTVVAKAAAEPPTVNEAGVKVAEVRKKDGTTFSADANIAEDMQRLNDGDLPTHQSHGGPEGHPKTSDAVKQGVEPYVEFLRKDIKGKTKEIRAAAKRAGATVELRTEPSTIVVKGDIHKFTDEYLGEGGSTPPPLNKAIPGQAEPPSDYIQPHKPFWNVAEAITFGQQSAADIANTWGIPKNEITKPIVELMAAERRDPQIVHDLLMRLEKENMTSALDPSGPGYHRVLKANAWQNTLEAAAKVPGGLAATEVLRQATTLVSHEAMMPDRNAHEHVVPYGISLKMGRKVWTPESAARVKYWAQKMWEADGLTARQRVKTAMDKEILQNLDDEGRLGHWEKWSGQMRKARAQGVDDAFTGGHQRSYGKNDRSLSPQTGTRLKYERDRLEAELKDTLGDSPEVAKALREVDKELIGYNKANKVVRDAEAHPGKYAKGANKDVLRKSEMYLDGLSSSQPLYTYQLRDGLMGEFNPRMMAWYQAGPVARNYLLRIDAPVLEPLTRVMKQVILGSLGFPLRVLGGDEYWRLVPEGIIPGSPRFNAALKTGRAMKGGEGMLSRAEKKEFTTLSEVKKPDDAQAARLEALTEKMQPSIDPAIYNKVVGEAMFEFDNWGTGDWALVPPNAESAGFNRAFPQVFQQVAQEPFMRDWLSLGDKRPTTRTEISSYLNDLVYSPSPEGLAIRTLLERDSKITAQMRDDPRLLKREMKSGDTAAETTAEVDKVVEEWTDRLEAANNPRLLKALKRGTITTKEMQEIGYDNLWAVPVQKAGRGASLGQSNFNPFKHIYEGVKIPERVPGIGGKKVGTLPLLSKLSGDLRSVLFSDKYNRELETLLKADPKMDPKLASETAADRAAAWTDKTTYTQNATILEDVSRNAFLFINSYRQFALYWGKSAAKNPLAYGAAWHNFPVDDKIMAQIGPLQWAFISGLPFWLQPRASGASVGGMVDQNMVKFSPLVSLPTAVGYKFITGNELPDGVPLLTSGGAMTGPLTRPGDFIYGLTGKDIGVLGRDKTTYEREHLKILRELGGNKDGTGPDYPWYLSWMTHLGVKYPEVMGRWASGTFSPVGMVKYMPKRADDIAAGWRAYDKVKDDPAKLAKLRASNKSFDVLLSYYEKSNTADGAAIAARAPWVIGYNVGGYTQSASGSVTLSADDFYNQLTSGDTQFKADATYIKQRLDATAKILGGVDSKGVSLGGDLTRKDAMEALKKQQKHIGEVTRRVALQMAGGDKNLAKDLLNNFHNYTDSPTYTDPQTKATKWEVPMLWEQAFKSRGINPQEMIYGQLLESFTQSYGTKPYYAGRGASEAALDTVIDLKKAGIIPDNLLAQQMDKADVPALQKRIKERNQEAIKVSLDVLSTAFYDADSRMFKRAGYNLGPEFDSAVLKVQKKYYEKLGNPVFKQKYGTSSREYRDARLGFNKYKDTVFSKVPGGEAFVGGLGERILHIPHFSTVKWGFSGPNAEKEQKTWAVYQKEALSVNPDPKKLKALKGHFDATLKDKWQDRQRVNDWVYAAAMAQQIRYQMKTSYSDYYQGPGNSVYSTKGKQMVKKLEGLISAQAGGDPVFADELKTYFGSSYSKDGIHDFAYNCLEWQYR